MLLQGDALAVQLFIGAAALTALSVAMTQAGWTHKWFVRGMFGLAALLSLSSVGWPYLEARIPLIADALETVASTRVAWFLIGIVPALVTGTLFSETMRRRRETSTKIPKTWMSALVAMETLARQDLLDRYLYVVKEAEQAFDEKMALEDQMSGLDILALSPDEAIRSEMAKRYVKLSTELDVVKARREVWNTTVEDCLSALQTNIHQQLQKGTLIAKGFLAPHSPGAIEKIIPIEEWRFLILDRHADQALGPNFEYIALLVGKPGH